MKFLQVIICDLVIGYGELIEEGQLADVLEGFACYFIAPDVQAFEVFEFIDGGHAVVVDLVVVDE